MLETSCFERKTSCFIIKKIAFTMAKDGSLESKTSCFAVSDSSDRYKISVTSIN